VDFGTSGALQPFDRIVIKANSNGKFCIDDLQYAEPFVPIGRCPQGSLKVDAGECGCDT
jgi:hypothetical protein